MVACEPAPILGVKVAGQLLVSTDHENVFVEGGELVLIPNKVSEDPPIQYGAGEDNEKVTVWEFPFKLVKIIQTMATKGLTTDFIINCFDLFFIPYLYHTKGRITRLGIKK
jgi:hypothetical protein